MNLVKKTKISRVMTPMMTTTIIILVALGSKRRWEDNAKMDLKAERARTGLIWKRETSGGIL